MATAKAERSIRLLSKPAAELNRITGLPGEIFLDSASQTLRLYNGITPGGSALAVNAILSDTPPAASTAKNGMLWFDTGTGKLYIYYNDGNSLQWIQPMTPSFSAGGSGGGLNTEQVQDVTAGLFNTTHTGITVSYNDSAATVTLAVANQAWSQITSKPTFATVATSGSYADLTNQPTIPTNTNQLTNGAGYITTTGIASQTGNSGKYLTTDGSTTSWATVTGTATAASVGLGNVTNESKATMFASPTFTGTVAGVTATHVGLGNVTNESKATMFASPTFTGTVAGVTATHVGLGSVTNESKATMFASPTFTGTVAAFSSATHTLTATGNLVFTGSSSGSVTFQAGATPADQTYTLPAAYPGVSGYALVSTTAGVLSWTSVAGSLAALTGVSITSPSAGQVLKYNGSLWINDADAVSGGAGVGTVTTVSVTSTNGFTGSVATASSTPAITIATSITGLLKGNGTAISAAVAGTDYQTAQSVTGIVKSSGTTRSAATSGTDYAPGTSALTTGIVKSTTTTGALTIAVAGTDYQVPITLTTTGSSGAATFSSGTLNIPQYSAAEADTLATVTGRGATTATAVSITNATAATTATSGALIVTGGVGVGGSIYTGGTLYGTATTFNIAPTPGAATGFPGKSITISSGAAPDTGVDAGVITLQGGAGSTNSIAGNINIIGGDCSGFGGLGGTITLTAGLSGETGTAGKVLINRTTASSSTTTGALVVSGGVGVAGAIYAGNIYSNGTQLAAGVTTFSALTDATSASLTVDELYLQAATRLNVTNNSATAYRFDQYGTTDDPTIYATSGTTIAFNLNVSGHPFLIRTSGGVNYNDGLVHVSTAGVVSTGSSAQGQVSGTLYWKIPSSISGAYQYICSIHSGMVGVITINPLAETATSVGLGNVTNESKATMFASPSFTGVTNANCLQTSGSATGSFSASKWFIQSEDANTIRSYSAGPDSSTNGIWEHYVSRSTGTPVLAQRWNADGNTVLRNIGVGLTIPTTSGHGITFPATQSASSDANTLDDYEEGTFTPTISGWTGTYAVQVGNYTKIGNMVFWNGRVGTNGGTGTFTANYPTLNTPFTLPATSQSNYGTLYFGGPGFTPGASFISVGTADQNNTTSFFINIQKVNGGIDNLVATMLTAASNFDIRFNLAFKVD